MRIKGEQKTGPDWSRRKFTGKMAGRLYLGFKCPRILIQLILIQLIYSFWNIFRVTSFEHFAFQSSLMVPQPQSKQSLRNTLYTTIQPKPNRYRILDIFRVSA